MAKYDGLIIPRSYSEYINKTDAATHAQAHQLSGVLDPAPAENSQNAVKSGGVFTALAGKQPTLTFDDVPTEDSNNPVKSNGIYDALTGKQDTLTFDNTPTQNSDNPVKSGGVYSAFGDWTLIKNLDSGGASYIEGKKIGRDKFIHIHLQNLQFNNFVIGSTIATYTGEYVSTVAVRALIDCDLDYGRVVGNLDVANGTINLYPIIANQYSGTVSGGMRLYGDAVILLK